MTNDLEHIPVPTNGKGPHPAAEPRPPDVSQPAELTVGFTPTQIAVGFGIVASLVVLGARYLRGRRRGGRR